MEKILYDLKSHIVDASGYLKVTLTPALGIPRGSLAGFGVYGPALWPKSMVKQSDGSIVLTIMSMTTPAALETVRIGLHHMWVSPDTPVIEDSYQVIAMLNTLPDTSK
jgi:hypothetical protein